MGLDSVALLVDVEKHFNISIPNSEAEKIYTVQDFADCVFTKVSFNPNQKCRSQILFYRFREFFASNFEIARSEFSPEKKLCSLIPLNELKKTWTEMEQCLSVKLPTLSKLDFDRTKKKEVKILGVKFWTRKTPVTDGTVGDLVRWTLSLNHERFLDARNLCNKADIERILIGLMTESLGIPVDEMKLGHSITDDLGVD
jgi:hypothetical protein